MGTSDIFFPSFLFPISLLFNMILKRERKQIISIFAFFVCVASPEKNEAWSDSKLYYGQ